MLVLHYLLNPLGDRDQRVGPVHHITCHEDLHAFELLFAFKQIVSHILKHGKCKVVYVDEEVFDAHHVIVLLVKLLLA